MTVYVEVWENHAGVQVSISDLDDNGAGDGYRLLGPKFDGTSRLLAKHELDERDAAELERFAKKVREVPA